jgi:TIR domain-containing protein
VPGERWATVIGAELERAGCVVVVWSERSVISDWVRAEARRGHERNVLVAVRLDGSRPPLPFGEIHTQDLSGWTGNRDDAGVRQVIAGVERLVQRPAAAPVSSGAKAAPAPMVDLQARRRHAVATLTIVIDGETFTPVVSDAAYLDGIAAARLASNAGNFATNQDYMQFVMSKWAEPYGDLKSALQDHNKHHPEQQAGSVDELIQSVVDRAVRSYWEQHLQVREPVPEAPVETNRGAPGQKDEGNSSVIKWDFHELLDYGSGTAGFWVTYFRLTGQNRSEEPLVNIKAQVIPQVGGEPVELKFQVGPNERVDTLDMLVEPGAPFVLSAAIPSPPHSHGHGYTAAEYLAKIGGFEFRFESDGVSFTQRFSYAEVKAMVLAAEERFGPKPPPPTVKKRR